VTEVDVVRRLVEYEKPRAFNNQSCKRQKSFLPF
jgi:hypothetical protein